MSMRTFRPTELRPFMLLPALAITLAVSPAAATVLTGPIVDLPEWTEPFAWGDGVHDLYQQWSVAIPTSAGWFYGSSYSYIELSNARVYVYRGLADPTTITDAESFPYSNDAVQASEGDCVFFRGTRGSANGYYGVWRIDAIDPLPGPEAHAKLNGQWYFQDDRTGDFTSDPTSASETTWGAIKALYK